MQNKVEEIISGMEAVRILKLDPKNGSAADKLKDVGILPVFSKKVGAGGISIYVKKSDVIVVLDKLEKQRTESKEEKKQKDDFRPDLDEKTSVSLRAYTSSIQRYLDTSFSQVDEVLGKTHTCAQQSVRVAGEVSNSQKSILNLMTSLVSSVNSVVSEAVNKFKTSIAHVQKNQQEDTQSILDEIALLRLEVREIGKRVK